MKKIFTILFICFALQSFAQGNLQFNQVLTFTGVITQTQPVGTTYTVPANKVWKIKFLSDPALIFASNVGNFSLYQGLMACINGAWITSPNSLKETFLKSGDTLKMGYYNQDSKNNQIPYAAITFDYLISIVEFNIVP